MYCKLRILRGPACHNTIFYHCFSISPQCQLLYMLVIQLEGQIQTSLYGGTPKCFTPFGLYVFSPSRGQKWVIGGPLRPSSSVACRLVRCVVWFIFRCALNCSFDYFFWLFFFNPQVARKSCTLIAGLSGPVSNH